MALQASSLLPRLVLRVIQVMLVQSLIHDTSSRDNTNVCVAIDSSRSGQDSNLQSALIGRRVSRLVASRSGRQQRILGVQRACVDQLHLTAYLWQLH